MPCPCNDEFCKELRTCCRIESIRAEYEIAKRNDDGQKQLELMGRLEEVIANPNTTRLRPHPALSRSMLNAMDVIAKDFRENGRPRRVEG